jgi:lactate dehydrogenase-like 2-hydroxyacid dehydrogenase
MDMTRPLALQLCPFSPELEQGIAARLTVERWFERDAAAQAAWLRDHAADVRAVVTGGHIGCPDALIEALPSLGLIAINGVGFDKVNLRTAADHAVTVTTTPGVLTDDVADLAVGLVIGLLRGLPQADAFVRAGRWERETLPLGRKVSGRRFGVLGLGQIGSAIARRLEPFGPVAYGGSRPKPVAYAHHASAVDLARESDVLIVACAANAETAGLVNQSVLDALGPDGWLVNVARGAVVDETALERALAAGGIAGAALDVFVDEPHVPSGLRDSDRTMLAPHIASATHETRRAMADMVLANIDAFLGGQPLPSALAMPTVRP